MWVKVVIAVDTVFCVYEILFYNYICACVLYICMYIIVYSHIAIELVA